MELRQNLKSIYSMTYLEFAKEFESHHINSAAAKILYRHFLKKKSLDECLDHNLSKAGCAYFFQHYHHDLPEIVHCHESMDQTVKFLVKLQDQLSIEMVLIPFQNKYTLCLSSQVGCAMNCSFCFTGTQGLKRNLKAEEIVGQFILAWNWLKTNRGEDLLIKNIVYMGQGEPLHNFDEVKKANYIFLDEMGIRLGIQKITVSTAGYLPGLKRWIEEMPGVNLALSLHSVDRETRNLLIPINQRFDLGEVIAIIDQIPLQRKQYVIFEYLLVNDVNDSEEHAAKTGEFLQGKRAIVNLIPFNPYPGALYEKPSLERVLNFQKILLQYQLPTLIRGTKGDDILAACGQLNSSKV